MSYTFWMEIANAPSLSKLTMYNGENHTSSKRIMASEIFNLITHSGGLQDLSLTGMAIFIRIYYLKIGFFTLVIQVENSSGRCSSFRYLKKITLSVRKTPLSLPLWL